MRNWTALTALALAQVVMVLDQAVMNVSISELVADFETTVTTIQAVITLYALVMAMFMLTGGKIGDIIGRRRAFIVGLVVYAAGSALTAVSWSVPTLTLGWSVLEGLGAVLVLSKGGASLSGPPGGAPLPRGAAGRYWGSSFRGLGTSRIPAAFSKSSIAMKCSNIAPT